VKFVGNGLQGRSCLGNGLQGRSCLGNGLQGRSCLGNGLQGRSCLNFKTKVYQNALGLKVIQDNVSLDLHCFKCQLLPDVNRGVNVKGF